MTTILALLLLATPTKAEKPTTMWGIRWVPSVEAAVKTASKSKKNPKLILHMRVLGELKGKT